MARTTRAHRGLNEAPDLLVLIERARRAAVAAGTTAPDTMPPEAVSIGSVPFGAVTPGPAPAAPIPPDSAPPDPPASGPTLSGTEGHRDRMRARLLAAGPDALADHEMLEMVLFLALPRRDTKPLARLLLTRFAQLRRQHRRARPSSPPSTAWARPAPPP